MYTNNVVAYLKTGTRKKLWYTTTPKKICVLIWHCELLFFSFSRKGIATLRFYAKVKTVQQNQIKKLNFPHNGHRGAKLHSLRFNRERKQEWKKENKTKRILWEGKSQSAALEQQEGRWVWDSVWGYINQLADASSLHYLVQFVFFFLWFFFRLEQQGVNVSQRERSSRGHGNVHHRDARGRLSLSHGAVKREWRRGEDR